MIHLVNTKMFNKFEMFVSMYSGITLYKPMLMVACIVWTMTETKYQDLTFHPGIKTVPKVAIS